MYMIQTYGSSCDQLGICDQQSNDGVWNHAGLFLLGARRLKARLCHSFKHSCMYDKLDLFERSQKQGIRWVFV